MPAAGKIAVIATASVLFLAISYFVARWLTADNRERNYVTQLLQDQANGDAPAMLAMMPACREEAACRLRVQALARRFRGGGDVTIVRLDSSTAGSMGPASGATRVAWQDGSPGSPVRVQCVEVQRRGLAFLGARVSLKSIGAPIAGEAPCPS